MTSPRRERASRDTRGQAHTLEAVSAGLLLLASVLFALQVTAVTPLTGSTSSQHIENQQAEMAEGLLASGAESGSLVPTLLHWNGSVDRFHGADDRGYQTGGPPTEFGKTLNRSLRDRGIAFNVDLYYIRSNGQRERQPLVHFGRPSDHASTAHRMVTLYDDDQLRDENGVETGTRVKDDDYFAPDIDVDGPVYNVIEVEVTIWRM